MPAEVPELVLVEDDPDDRMLIGRALARLRPGLRRAAVADGIDLMRLLEQLPSPPQLVLLDLNLPRMDGREVLQRLAGGLPVVVFTTSVEPEDRARALKLGALEVLSKPDRFGALVELLGGVLDRHLARVAA